MKIEDTSRMSTRGVCDTKRLAKNIKAEELTLDRIIGTLNTGGGQANHHENINRSNYAFIEVPGQQLFVPSQPFTEEQKEQVGHCNMNFSF